MDKIKKFDLRYSQDEIKQFLGLAEEVLHRGFLAEGPLVKKLEDKFVNYIGTPYATLVGSGTDALQAAYSAANQLYKDKLKSDFEILIPVNTFVATEIAAHLIGAKVRYIDVDEHDGMPTKRIIESAITDNTCALVFVYIGGSIPDRIKEIKALCHDRGIVLIEDAAHAMGSSLEGKAAGTFGDFGCFSFFPTKSMTFGEGGLVTSNHYSSHHLVKALKNFGRTTNIEDHHEYLGYNMKVTEMQAALGLVEMDRFETRLKKRRRLFEVYLDNLISIDCDILHADRFHISSCYKIILRGDKEYLSRVSEKLDSANVSVTGRVYSRPLNEQEYNNPSSETQYLGGKHFCEGHICPPLYPELNIEEIKYVASIIREA